MLPEYGNILSERHLSHPLLQILYPILQDESDSRKYCAANQPSFQRTCLPGKTLRYDLKVGTVGVIMNTLSIYNIHQRVSGQKVPRA